MEHFSQLLFTFQSKCTFKNKNLPIHYYTRMSVKRNPISLYDICLMKVGKVLVQKWVDTYYTKYSQYSDEIKKNMCILIPYTVYDQLFEVMIRTHVSVMNSSDDKIAFLSSIDRTRPLPSITSLIASIISPNFHKLNLNCIPYISTKLIQEGELEQFQNVISTELPYLNNLVEINLKKTSTEFTLPMCSDKMLKEIGRSCQNLKTIDISYNPTVTDQGIVYLIPSNSHKGCPLLNKISILECAITTNGVCVLLKNISKLKIVGYREIGQCLLLLNKQINTSSFVTLELAYINNLGIISRTSKDFNKLRCDINMVDIIYTFCPNLSVLKVRVCDADLPFFERLSSVTELELSYNLGALSSPGNNTITYLMNNGPQLASLSFECDVFSTHYLKTVCEQCPNLKRLLIGANQFNCDHDLMTSDKRKCSLINLEVLFFRVGCLRFESCYRSTPNNVIYYVLHKSNALRELVLSIRSDYLNDACIQELICSINTSKVERIMIQVPCNGPSASVSSLKLTMASVNEIVGACPQLEILGNLRFWDISLEEAQHLKRKLKMSNCALVLVTR